MMMQVDAGPRIAMVVVARAKTVVNKDRRAVMPLVQMMAVGVMEPVPVTAMEAVTVPMAMTVPESMAVVFVRVTREHDVGGLVAVADKMSPVMLGPGGPGQARDQHG